MRKPRDEEIIEYKPRLSAAERLRMAAEDAALARERDALVRRASFRVVAGRDFERNGATRWRQRSVTQRDGA
jgi:hypothetical protein